MNPSEAEIDAYVEKAGFKKIVTDRGEIEYTLGDGVTKAIVSFDDVSSIYCYNHKQNRHDSNGVVLNERGQIAKVGDVILRGPNGYPLQRIEKDGKPGKVKDLKEEKEDVN